MRAGVPCLSVLVGLPVLIGQALLATSATWGGEAHNERFRDEQVQQAAHRNHANQRSVRPTHQPAALFHGQELRLPAMPFARAGSQPQPSSGTAASAAGRAGSHAARPTAMPVPPPGSGTSRLAPHQAPPQPHIVNPHQASLTNPDYNPNVRPAGQQQSPAGPAQRVAEPRRDGKPTISENTLHAWGPPLAELERTPVAVSSESMVSEKPSHTEEQPVAAPSSPADRLMVQAHELSRTAQSVEDYSRVIETCRRTKVSQPSDEIARYANELSAWAMNRRGQLKAEAGRLQEAMLDFDDAVRADPNCWRAIHNRGVLLAQQGQFEKAFDDFNRTIAVNGQFAKAYSNRAALFLVAGDLFPAAGDYQRAIELDPNLAVAHRGRGRVCHLLGMLDEALGHYDAAAQLTPEDDYALASRADLLVDLGRYSDAAADYRRAIELDPRSVHAYRGSAWLLATCPDDSIRDPARAIELAEFALRLDSKQEALDLDTLAAAQAAAGDFPAAMRTMHRAIELAPEDECIAYQDRLLMYQHARPFRIAPLRPVMQASYEAGSREPGAGIHRF